MGKENTTLHLPVLLTPGKRVNKDCSRKINDTFPPFEKSKHRLSKIKSEKNPETKQNKSNQREEKGNKKKKKRKEKSRDEEKERKREQKKDQQENKR